MVLTRTKLLVGLCTVFVSADDTSNGITEENHGYTISFHGECVSVKDVTQLWWQDCERYDGKVLAPKWMFVESENEANTDYDHKYGKIKATVCDSAGVKGEYCWTVQGTTNGIITLEKCRESCYPPQDFYVTDTEIWSMLKTGARGIPIYRVFPKSQSALRTERYNKFFDIQFGNYEVPDDDDDIDDDGDLTRIEKYNTYGNSTTIPGCELPKLMLTVFDENKDEVLSESEFGNLLASDPDQDSEPKNPRMQGLYTSQLLRLFDVNGDGKMAVVELCMMMEMEKKMDGK